MNTAASLSIGLLARQAGCSVPTIRYYEEIGLLPVVPRTEGGRRVYGSATVRRLSFIRRCRDFGFLNRAGSRARPDSRSEAQAFDF